MIDWKTARENLPAIPPGKLEGDLPAKEADHFMKCNSCGGYFDMRDLGEVFRHEEADHKAEKPQ